MTQKKKLPMQPLYQDGAGVIRFMENGIVRWLLDWSSSRGMSLNDLAMMRFSDEDRQQFAQLIGYSLSGYSELSYVTDAAYERAELAAKAMTESAVVKTVESEPPSLSDLQEWWRMGECVDDDDYDAFSDRAIELLGNILRSMESASHAVSQNLKDERG